MAVTAASRPVPYGQRSPTLSDAGMILPRAFDGDFDRSASPAPFIARPPSPPSLSLYSHTNSSQVKLGSAPQSRRRASQQTKSPSLSAQSSRSTLRNMADSEVVTKSPAARDEALASSPTIENAPSGQSPNKWNGQERQKLSPSSSSIFTEDLDHWPGFDSHDNFEDSGVDLEEQEKRDHFTSEADVSDDMESERWPDERNSGSDEDDGPYSSAALSRRAEIILANAKKRLNVCVPLHANEQDGC
jgi:hypothetical protein